MNFANSPKIKKILDHPLSLFIVGTVVTLLLSTIVLTLLGLIPKELSNSTTNNGISIESADNSTLFGVDFIKGTNKIHGIQAISADDIPARVISTQLGLDTKVSNPETTDIKTLDGELLKNAVRYPGSGTLASGNMFIFGHSTGFKVVNNPAYKAFNEIKKLKEGDKIEVQAVSGKTFTYRVLSVEIASKYDTYISFTAKSPTLTLTTCDSFGKRSDRYVVKAIRE
jgi:LPXTG-site transpeptidase (sortase) family protein